MPSLLFLFSKEEKNFIKHVLSNDLHYFISKAAQQTKQESFSGSGFNNLASFSSVLNDG